LRAPRRCSWCRSLEHVDRDKYDGTPACPGRAAWLAERAAAQLRARVKRGPCSTCGDEIATTEVFLGEVGKSTSFWAGPRCVEMFKQLAIALGGNPKASSKPALRVVR
jgi:hypothetical protein